MTAERFIIVEDDPWHAELLARRLKERFPRTTVEILLTEKMFREALEAIASNPPLAVILDQMLPWTEEDDPDAKTGAPAEGPLRAGTRCFERLQSDPRTRNIPVVFVSNLDGSTFPAGAKAIVRKSADPKLSEVLKVLEAVEASRHESR